MKPKLLQTQNLLTSLKALAISLLAGLITFIPYAIGVWLTINQKILIGRGVMLLTFVFYLYLWGFLANKFWRWK
jgi:hypothetical protein